jgi:hypothetical protein
MRDPFTPPGDEDQMLMLATDLSDEAAINETNLKRLELILTE